MTEFRNTVLSRAGFPDSASPFRDAVPSIMRRAEWRSGLAMLRDRMARTAKASARACGPLGLDSDSVMSANWDARDLAIVESEIAFCEAAASDPASEIVSLIAADAANEGADTETLTIDAIESAIVADLADGHNAPTVANRARLFSAEGSFDARRRGGPPRAVQAARRGVLVAAGSTHDTTTTDEDAMTAPTPLRYRVDDYQPSTDPRRMATIRDVLTATTLTVTGEDEARHLIEQLTAWLDAPRLAAREKAEVVETRPARYGTGDAKLVRTADFGEWAVISSRGGLYCGWGAWSEGERQARGVFDIVTTKDLP